MVEEGEVKKVEDSEEEKLVRRFAKFLEHVAKSDKGVVARFSYKSSDAKKGTTGEEQHG